MRSLLRRIRGLLGLGAFSGIVWAGVGALIGAVVLLVDPASVDPGEGPLWIAYYFGRAGFVAGAGAALLLALAERRRSLDSLSTLRVALWGAVGGIALPWLAVAPVAMWPLFMILGAGTTAFALRLARRPVSALKGERPADDLLEAR